MKDYTDITVLVDRSGSMQSIKSAMESGFDEFLLEHKKVPSTRLTLIQFDGHNHQETIYTARSIDEAPRLSIDPRGATPLIDAFCSAIDNTGRRLASMKEADRPERVLFVVITDGEENASRHRTKADLRSRIEEQSAHYKWNFVFLGANQDAISEAAQYGIAAANAMSFAAAAAGTQNLWKSVGDATATYASTGNLRGFTEKERSRAMATKKDKV